MDNTIESLAFDLMIARVADQAFPSVIQAFHDMLAEVPDDAEEEEKLDYIFNSEGMYLYVYGDGGWIIDAPSYLQDHRNIVASASVYQYSGVHALEQELQQSTF